MQKPEQYYIDMEKDRIRKDREIKERISREAYVETPGNKPVTDGPIDPKRFYTTKKPRVVFITQEPYGDNGGWDLSESLRNKNSLRQQPAKGKPTFSNEVKTASQLNGRDENHNSQEAYDNYKETTAHINIKKEPNTLNSRSNPNTLKKHYEKNKDILQEQYDNSNLNEKDTVILAGTKQQMVKYKDGKAEIFGRKFDKKDITIIKIGRHEYVRYDNGDGGPVIISAPHPSALGQTGDYGENIRKVRNYNSEETKNNSTSSNNVSKNIVEDQCAQTDETIDPSILDEIRCKVDSIQQYVSNYNYDSIIDPSQLDELCTMIENASKGVEYEEILNILDDICEECEQVMQDEEFEELLNDCHSTINDYLTNDHYEFNDKITDALSQVNKLVKEFNANEFISSTLDKIL